MGSGFQILKRGSNQDERLIPVRREEVGWVAEPMAHEDKHNVSENS